MTKDDPEICLGRDIGFFLVLLRWLPAQFLFCALSHALCPWLVLVWGRNGSGGSPQLQRKPDESYVLCLGARGVFTSPLMTLQPRPFHSLSCGTKQVHCTFWGSSVPSPYFFGWDICSSLSSSVADCLFFRFTGPSKSSVTGIGFLIHSSCTCLDSWKFVEVHWTVRAPLVCHIERFSCGT